MADVANGFGLLVDVEVDDISVLIEKVAVAEKLESAANDKNKKQQTQQQSAVEQRSANQKPHGGGQGERKRGDRAPGSGRSSEPYANGKRNDRGPYGGRDTNVNSRGRGPGARGGGRGRGRDSGNHVGFGVQKAAPQTNSDGWVQVPPRHGKGNGFATGSFGDDEKTERNFNRNYNSDRRDGNRGYRERRAFDSGRGRESNDGSDGKVDSVNVHNNETIERDAGATLDTVQDQVAEHKEKTPEELEQEEKRKKDLEKRGKEEEEREKEIEESRKREEEEARLMTLAEYEKLQAEKRKALMEEEVLRIHKREVAAEEFADMKLLGKKKEVETVQKPEKEKDKLKKKASLDDELKKKSESLRNMFRLPPVDRNRGGRGRGGDSRTGGRGGDFEESKTTANLETGNGNGIKGQHVGGGQVKANGANGHVPVQRDGGETRNGNWNYNRDGGRSDRGFRNGNNGGAAGGGFRNRVDGGGFRDRERGEIRAQAAEGGRFRANEFPQLGVDQ